MRNYLCKKCATLVKSDKKPISFNCPSGGNHQWTDLGEVGTTNYQCQKCGLLLKSQKSQLVLTVLVEEIINGHSSNL